MFKIKEFDDGHARIEWPNETGDNCEWFLHSDGSILKTVELWPTWADAETILAKYPNAAPPVAEPPHEWVHGDVFACSLTTDILIYFTPKLSEPLAFCIDGCHGPAVDLAESLKDAKFLFNINDAVKERQAATDEAKRVAESTEDINRAVPPQGQREFGGLG